MLITTTGLLLLAIRKEVFMLGWLKFKSYFNWSMRHQNPAIQARNFHLLWVILRSFFVLILITIPVMVYAYVLYQNLNVAAYISYKSSDGQPIWYYLHLPNGSTMKPFLWIGFGFLCFAFVLMVFFKPLVSGKSTITTKYGLTGVITVIILLAFLFFSLSQYKYSQFQDFFYYEIHSTGDGADIKQAWAQALAKLFRTNYVGGISNYNWEATVVVWWVLIVQVMVVFAMIVGLQNAVYDHQIVNDETPSKELETVEQIMLMDRFSRRISNLFRNNEHNVSIFMSVVTGLIVIPNLIYAIISTTPGTNLNALVSWSYKLPRFLKDNLDQAPLNDLQGIESSYYGNLFIIGSLPLICLGLTISTLFFFLAALFRGKHLSNKLFMLETVLLVIYLLLLISVMFVAKVYMHRLQSYWNAPVNNTTRAINFFTVLKTSMQNIGGETDSEFNQLIHHFKISGLMNPHGFEMEWLSGPSIIGEAIISYSFVIGAFVLISYDIVKLAYNHKVKVKKALVNKTLN